MVTYITSFCIWTPSFNCTLSTRPIRAAICPLDRTVLRATAKVGQHLLLGFVRLRLSTRDCISFAMSLHWLATLLRPKDFRSSGSKLLLNADNSAETVAKVRTLDDEPLAEWYTSTDSLKSFDAKSTNWTTLPAIPRAERGSIIIEHWAACRALSMYDGHRVRLQAFEEKDELFTYSRHKRPQSSLSV